MKRKSAARKTSLAAALATAFSLPSLKKGEHYAGLILAEDGGVSHHLVLLPGDEKLAWQPAIDWAKKQGGELPTRQEQSLLFANLKGKFETTWYWSAAQDAGAPGWAWCQLVSNGDQYCSGKSSKLRARAVRRVPIR
jgi:hypothetical protein